MRVDGQDVTLTNKEFELLCLLLDNQGLVLTRQVLMDRIWGFDAEAETDVIWTYISFLRKKLRQIDSDAEIKTIRGAGYALDTRE